MLDNEDDEELDYSFIDNFDGNCENTSDASCSTAGEDDGDELINPCDQIEEIQLLHSQLQH